MKYDVHVYAVVRVKVPAIEAESKIEAVKKAQAVLDDGTLTHMFRHESTGSARPYDTEFADEITSYLVDGLSPNGVYNPNDSESFEFEEVQSHIYQDDGKRIGDH